MTCECQMVKSLGSLIKLYYRHDEIGNILDVMCKSFEETYEDKAKEFKRILMKYIKTIQVTKARADIGAGAGNSLAICLNPQRFPIVPQPLL